MADDTKPWQHWWFWALMIPILGVMVPISEALPLRDPFFWLILVAGGGSLYVARRAMPGHDKVLKQLRAEVDDLRLQLLRREVTESIVDAEDLVTIERSAKGIVVILFSDIEGFTRFVEHHGDEVAYERLKFHNQLVRRAIRQHDGTEVKHLGDGFMVNFASARDALLCAAEIQSQLRTINDEEMPLQVRIGIHAGEPIQAEQDFVGRTVIVAQRIMGQADGGQIFVSEVVRNLVGPLKGYQYVELGKRRLEGITEPQALYHFQPIEALAAPLDSVVDKRLKTLEERLGRHP